ncbi:hypothetical protein BD289DRAFT_461526 [Coniella lustricola]|uniref:PQ loop repeat-domain-containing protein n=1 Tax=Coniella lustricola TaxID=2025994 RepID=A0A2T3A500_9PEZI|nr:hypothetical protein BD289DRAFT_461526 [Coniella lustricola]
MGLNALRFWVVPLSIVALGLGVVFWDATYILMARCSMPKKVPYSTPLMGLALKLNWEIVYALYVSETPLEIAGFTIWSLLDIGLIYTTVKCAPLEWKRSSLWIGQNIVAILSLMTAVGCIGHFTFVSRWLSESGIGRGDKRGKWDFDRDDIGSLAMLLVRGHSGGTSYTIWFCGTLRTVIDLGLSSAILWYGWSEAHGYLTKPFDLFLLGTTILANLMYLIGLWKVRATVVVLADGRILIDQLLQQVSHAKAWSENCQQPNTG